MPFFTYACLVCYFASLGFVGCEAWASAAAADDDGGAAVANPRRFLPGGHQVSWIKNDKVLRVVREFQGHDAIVDDQGRLRLPNKGWKIAAYNSAANDYVQAMIANKTVPSDVMDVMRCVPKDDYGLMGYLKRNIVTQINKALADGVIITQPIPKFLQDTFENSAERVLREYIDSRRYDRSILEHIKTRAAPWIVKGSTDLSQKVIGMVLNMANEYDVFDQERLRAYQNGSQIKPFAVIPIELCRNINNTIRLMFAANLNSTLVVDFGGVEIKEGNMERIVHIPGITNPIGFVNLKLRDARYCLYSNDGGNFVIINLVNVGEPGRSTMLEAFKRSGRKPFDCS